MNPESSPSSVDLDPRTPKREWDLLQALSSLNSNQGDRERIGPLLADKIDWEAVLRLADHHGTSLLLYQQLSNFPSGVPSSVLLLLRERFETNVHKSLFLTRELIRILDCVEGLGVEVLPYKGVVLSETYYGDMALRQSGDMDVFVRRRDVARIKQAVRNLGYTLRLAIPDDAEEDYLSSGYEWTFDSPAGKNLLELQWALQPRFYAVDFDMEGLFERAMTASVAGRVMKTPSADDLLLVLSLHAAKHVWGRLIWLCDIAQLLTQGKLNWKWIDAQARELGIERILHVTLRLTNLFLAIPIPAPAEDAVGADRSAKALAEEVAAGVMRGVSYEEAQVSYFHLMMRLRERRADQLRFLLRLTLTPGPGEWETMRLPRAAFPLYRVVRLARLASRFARG